METPTCRKCKEYKSCAKKLKRMGINPDDPNNEAIMICSRYYPVAPAVAQRMKG